MMVEKNQQICIKKKKSTNLYNVGEPKTNKKFSITTTKSSFSDVIIFSNC